MTHEEEVEEARNELNTIERLRMRRTHLASEVDSLQARVDGLSRQAQEAQQAHDTLIESLSGKHADVAAEVVALRERHHSLHSEVVEAQRELAAVRAEQATRVQSLDRLKAEIEALPQREARAGELRRLIDGYEREVEDLTRELAQVRDLIESQKATLENARTELGTITQEVGRLRGQKASLESELRDARARVGAINASLSDREAEVARRESAANEMERDAQFRLEAAKDAEEAAARKLASADEKIAAAEASVASTTAAREAVDNDRKVVEARAEELEGVRHELSVQAQELETRQADVGQAEARNAEWAERLKRREVELEAMVSKERAAARKERVAKP